MRCRCVPNPSIILGGRTDGFQKVDLRSGALDVRGFMDTSRLGADLPRPWAMSVHTSSRGANQWNCSECCLGSTFFRSSAAARAVGGLFLLSGFPDPFKKNSHLSCVSDGPKAPPPQVSCDISLDTARGETHPAFVRSGATGETQGAVRWGGAGVALREGLLRHSHQASAIARLLHRAQWRRPRGMRLRREGMSMR